MALVERVLVVGGGIAGLATAISLCDRNVSGDLVEIQKDWKVYGVGIIQQSNVVRAMAQLGLVERYLSMSFPFDKVGIYSPIGERVALIPGKRLAGPEYPANLGISRPALHEILTSEARKRGCAVRLGVTVDSISQTPDYAEVSFTDGTVGKYDVVVGADGIYSKMRSMLFPDAPKPRYTGQAVWRYNFKRDPEIDHLATFHGPHGAAGLVPLADDLMYMFVTSTEPDNPKMDPNQLHTLMKERMAPFGGLIGRLREQITDPAGVVYKPIETLLLPSPWFNGRAVLIGDAAHSATPHMGQGAGMAIEDAIVLSEELASAGTVQQAFGRFMARRFDRCKYIVDTSAMIGEAQIRHERINEPQIIAEMLDRTAEPI